MQVIHPVCCGIDCHQAQLTVCLRRVSEDGQITTQLREFGTIYQDLLALSDWLVEEACPVVAMESTGVYWKPVYHVLSGVVEVYIGNPFDMRRRPGKKTDKADATWIAELLAHGLIQPSFVPPPEISALRDLTRSRVVLVQTRTRAKNRIQGLLQDTNIKMSSVLAVAHKILVMIYHLLSDGTFYEEGRYVHVGPQQQERERKRAIKALERLGYSVTVEKVA
jgi:transposase